MEVLLIAAPGGTGEAERRNLHVSFSPFLLPALFFLLLVRCLSAVMLNGVNARVGAAVIYQCYCL